MTNAKGATSLKKHLAVKLGVGGFVNGVANGLIIFLINLNGASEFAMDHMIVDFSITFIILGMICAFVEKASISKLLKEKKLVHQQAPSSTFFIKLFELPTWLIGAIFSVLLGAMLVAISVLVYAVFGFAPNNLQYAVFKGLACGVFATVFTLAIVLGVIGAQPKETK